MRSAGSRVTSPTEARASTAGLGRSARSAARRKMYFVTGNVQLIEDGDAQAFRWGDTGRPHAFRTDADGEVEKAFRGAVAEGIVRGEAHLLRGVEREIAQKLSAGIGIRKDVNDSVYVSWFLPDDLAQQLAALVPGGMALDAHLTLLFLGDPDADGSGPWDLDHVNAVCKLFSMECCPVDARVSGLGRFVGDGDTDFVVALVDAPGLGAMRASLKERLLYSGAVPDNSPLWNEAHGFVPHITLAQPQAGMSVDLKMQDSVEFEVDGLSLSYGAQHVDYKFPEYSMENATPYYMSRTPISTEDVERAVSESTSTEGDMVYVVEKANDEQRYTLGPLYAPERKDAHGEGVDAEDLQKAVWDYVRESSAKGRRLNLQHGDLGDVQVGEWVEVMAWPYEHTITLKSAEGEREVQMPAGTVYMGVQWDEPAWPLVKSGKLSGYSLGGTAVRVKSDVDWESMGGGADTEKAGRVLSGSNYKKIQDAMDALMKVIQSAMPKDAEEEQPAAKATEGGSTDGVLELLTGAAEKLRKREDDLREREQASASEVRAQAKQDRETLMEERALLREALDGLREALTAKASERLPDLHVHVPEQNLVINAGDDAEVVED